MNRYLEKIAASYQEPDSTFTHNGKTYDLNPILRKANALPVVSIPVSKLEWVLEHSTPDPDRVSAADISVPVLVVDDPQFGHTAIDGLHRLTKAIDQGKSHIPARMVPMEWLKS